LYQHHILSLCLLHKYRSTLLSYLPFYHCVCSIHIAQYYCRTYHFITVYFAYIPLNVTVILIISLLCLLHTYCSMLLSYLPIHHCACCIHTAQCYCHTYHFIIVAVTYIPLNVSVILTISSLCTYCSMLRSYLPFYHCAVTYILLNVTFILTILSLCLLHTYRSMLLSYLPFYH
jgi:hypothetical protein